MTAKAKKYLTITNRENISLEFKGFFCFRRGFMSVRRIFLWFAIAILLATGTQTKSLGTDGKSKNETGLIAGRNVNIVPYPLTDPETGDLIPHTGDPYLQSQNEPSIAVSTRNPLHLLAGANDYRTIDIPFKNELPGLKNASAAKDAWLGVFKSVDGGQTWKNTLLPGFPQDTSVEGTSSPLFGFTAAADPVVRAGTNGLFYYSGIVFNREDYRRSKVFVSRYIDNNNKENNVDSIKYIDTHIIDSAKGLRFIDKPHIANDIPRGQIEKIWIAGQKIPRSNVYIAYTEFYGTEENPNAVTKIFFARSTNCGQSWHKPRVLDIAWDFASGKNKSDYYDEYRCFRKRGRGANQGAVIAVDPNNGDVYVAWRRFGMGERPDAILIAKSTDQGKRFSEPIKVVEIDPFDQPTSPAMVRTNDYPTMVVDHNSVVYIAWTQRRLGPYFEARIMITASKNGKKWSTPAQVISDEDAHRHGNDPPGYQLMPQLTYAAGKLSMLWYNHRWALVTDHFTDRNIQDTHPPLRHTIDVRFAQALTSDPYSNPPPNPEFSPSIQVTRYPFLLFTEDDPPVAGNIWNAIQLLFNRPDLFLSAQGTVPFMGDYIGIAPSPLILPPDPNDPYGNWTFNTDPETATVYHAVWTDNRDVIPPGAKGLWTKDNAPKGAGTKPDFTRARNQNIYTSRIYEE